MVFLLFTGFLQREVRSYDIKCEVCKTISTIGGSFLNKSKGYSYTIIEDIVYPICIHLNASNNCRGDSCKGLCRSIIKEYVPVIMEGLEDSMSKGDHSLCASLKYCPPMFQKNISTKALIYSDLNNYSGERHWKNWGDMGGGSDVGYFVHMTDMHIDPYYKEGLPVVCDLPMCCRDQGSEGEGEGEGEGVVVSGYWGTVNVSCDIPVRLSEAVHKWFAGNMKPDFFINTGDDPPHNIWEQSKEFNMNVTNTVAEHHKIAFGEIPSFVSIGNHEYFPVDIARGNSEDDWLYDNMANTWKYWLADDAVKTLRFGGFYTARARPHLRIISLNTMLLVPDSTFSRDFLKGSWPDPMAQMAWFNNTLRDSYENKTEKIIVLAHHPFDDWDERVRNVYSDIIAKYGGNILMQLHGHSHMNEYFLLYSNGKPMVPAFVGGSLSTTGIAENNKMGCGLSGNPGFNVYYYNRTSLELLDLEYWWADLNYANVHHIVPQWKKQYSAKEIYRLGDFSALSWELVDEKIKKNHTMKQLYDIIWSKGIVY
jgi:sphingomyelin phosphodiesterase